MSDEKIKAPKGLVNTVVDQTAVSKVMAESNSLTYRGYRVQDLAEHCLFEEVAYLLWYRDLPTVGELEVFQEKEKSYRALTPELQTVIAQFPKQAHPMDAVRTAVSFMGMEDERVWDNDPETNADKSIRLLAKIPTAIACAYRHSQGKSFISPHKDYSLAENFFYMCFGELPPQKVVHAFNGSLILYAEHGFNASTFTSRVVTSTLSDLYSAVTGAIGALKGPLHGGANEQVMQTMLEIEDPERAREWLKQALAEKRKIMGFGHRVYRKGDSRVPTMKKYADELAEITGETKWMSIYKELEDEMYQQKGIYPNLDFPAGPAYYMMGFEIPMFTPFFVMARTTGWCAHIMEQLEENRIIRPLADYSGVDERDLSPIESR